MAVVEPATEPVAAVQGAEIVEETVDVVDAPRRRRVPWKIVIPAVAVAVAAATVALLLRPGDPGYDVDTALTAAANRAGAPIALAASASSLDQLRTAGRASSDAQAAVSVTLGRLDEVRNDKDRAAARQVLTAEQRLLAGFARLGTLSDEDLTTWRDGSVEVSAAARDIDAAVGAVELRRLPGDFRGLVAAARAGAVNVDGLVAAVERKLEAWRGELAKAQADKGAQLAALDAYASAFRAQMTKYTGLRNEMSDFVRRVDNEGATYTEVYTFLGGAAAKRQEVRNAVAALTPPAPVAGAHTGLLAVIDSSITAVQAATDGVRQYQYSWLYYSYKSTPGWLTFREKSGQISASYGDALAAWEKQVTGEKARLEQLALPAKPAV